MRRRTTAVTSAGPRGGTHVTSSPKNSGRFILTASLSGGSVYGTGETECSGGGCTGIDVRTYVYVHATKSNGDPTAYPNDCFEGDYSINGVNYVACSTSARVGYGAEPLGSGGADGFHGGEVGDKWYETATSLMF